MLQIAHSLDHIRTLLSQEINSYKKLVEESPQGDLQHMIQSGRTIWLHATPREEGGGYRRRTINGQGDMIRKLAEKAFAKKVLEVAERNEAVLTRAGRAIRDPSYETVRAGMKRAYRDLPDECYRRFREPEMEERRRLWMNAPYRQSNNYPEGRKVDTGRGFRVRSRAEALIVEKLFELGVPFHYEESLVVDGHDLAPDFTFPGRGGEEFYLEYCGMMDDPDYVSRFYWKRRLYEKAGITEWNNMIYLYGKREELDMNQIDAAIRFWVLPGIL